MKALKNILVRLSLISVSMLFGLLLVEAAVRVSGVYRFPVDDFIEPHPELGWSHVPNKEGYWSIGNQDIPVKINSKGLRERKKMLSWSFKIFSGMMPVRHWPLRGINPPEAGYLIPYLLILYLRVE